MPTIDNVGSYTVFFASNDGEEPAHVHVREGKNVAKVWLTPVRVAKCGRFPDHKINEIRKLVAQHRNEYLREWNEFFDVT